MHIYTHIHRILKRMQAVLKKGSKTGFQGDSNVVNTFHFWVDKLIRKKSATKKGFILMVFWNK